MMMIEGWMEGDDVVGAFEGDDVVGTSEGADAGASDWDGVSEGDDDEREDNVAPAAKSWQPHFSFTRLGKKVHRFNGIIPVYPASCNLPQETEGCPGNITIAFSSVTHSPGPQMEQPTSLGSIGGHVVVITDVGDDDDDATTTSVVVVGVMEGKFPFEGLGVVVGTGWEVTFSSIGSSLSWRRRNNVGMFSSSIGSLLSFL